MLKRNLRKAVLLSGLLILSAISREASAEVTLLKQNRQDPDWLSRLNLSVWGSIRPQFFDVMGDGDRGSYKRNGFDNGDNGTRIGITADYYLKDGISWYNYYEFNFNLPATTKWRHHYDNSDSWTSRRQLYTGLKSDELGTLTIGKQTSVYYDVVGSKTDLWDDDMFGQATGVGVNGDRDGSYRPSRQLKFKNSYGKADLYAGWLFPDSEYLPGDGTHYRRRGGGSLGIDYHITPTLTWGVAWNETRATIKHPGIGDDRKYNQHIVGTGVSWAPDNWTFALSGGWYNNFLPTGSDSTRHYFAGDGWGTEYYASYTFLIQRLGISSIQPFFMGDRLQYTSGKSYKRIDNGLGILLAFDHGFSVDFEHMFTSSTDHIGDANLVRLSYDF